MKIPLYVYPKIYQQKHISKLLEQINKFRQQKEYYKSDLLLKILTIMYKISIGVINNQVVVKPLLKTCGICKQRKIETYHCLGLTDTRIITKWCCSECIKKSDLATSQVEWCVPIDNTYAIIHPESGQPIIPEINLLVFE